MRVIDLFAGCGGLSSGFHKEGIEISAHLDWDTACARTLKRHYGDPEELGYLSKIYQADIRSTDELFSTNQNSFSSWIETLGGVDGVIGGPPCQAYSLAGRIRDENGMRDDYRNFLFEAYAKLVEKVLPKYFVFENVPGTLSATPNGTRIPDAIRLAFSDIGFLVNPISKDQIFDLANFGGPQFRKRLIIFGVRKSYRNANQILDQFYEFLAQNGDHARNASDAIGDLEAIYPSPEPTKRISHIYNGTDPLHAPRFHNERDIEIFRLLAAAAQSGSSEYASTKSLRELYTSRVGKTSKVHKYHVVDWAKPSNLIPTHLYKDGLRHIHPDPLQARSLTPREAARLQTFGDDYWFYGSRTDLYKMIGNAVAPLMASKIAQAVLSVSDQL